MDLTEQRITTKPVFDGCLLHVRADTVRLPNGDTAPREWIDHCGAAAIIAFDEQGRLLLVRQYRYPLGREILEIPAGKLEPGEDPAVCAARELEEETGYTAEHLTLLATMAAAPAYTTEVLHLYLASGTKKTAQHLDADEFLTVEHWDMKDVESLLDKNGLIDAKTQIGIMKYLRRMK